MFQAISHSPFWIRLFLLLSLLCSNSVKAQEGLSKKSASGIIGPLVQTIQENKTELAVFKKGLKSSSTQIIDKKNIRNFKIAPIQMASILLFTPGRYIQWANADYCRFLSLLENGLIKDANGPVNKLILQVKSATPEQTDETFYIGVQRFIRISYSNQCIRNRTFQTLFKEDNVRSTLNKLQIKQQKSSTECRDQFSTLSKGGMVPYLCGPVEQQKLLRSYLKLQKSLRNSGKVIPFSLSSKIKQIQSTQSKLSKYEKSYLSQFCGALGDNERFCDKQLNNDLWTEIQSGQRPEYLVSYICQSFFPNQKDSKALSNCLTILRSSPQACLTANYHSSPSMLPRPDCKLLEKNLGKSRLYTDYNDCPGFISNTYITNTARIIKHFKKEKEMTERSCTDVLYQEVAQLYYNYDSKKTFDTKICYKNPIKDKRECLSYLPGASSEIPNSESKILAKALYYIRGIPKDTQCRMANFNKFNPHLLEYKNGCVITYKDRNCTTFGCPKNIYFNSMIINGIEYEGSLQIDYRPSNFNHTQYAINKQIKKVYKVKEKVIHNLTEVKFFLDLNSDNIIHGVGCAEDIYPRRFTRYSMNQCRILPFIIDGHRNEKNQTLLITRTAIDDLHSPRAINWVLLYSALKSYQQIHPLNSWTLYGIRK